MKNSVVAVFVVASALLMSAQEIQPTGTEGSFSSLTHSESGFWRRKH